MILAAMERPAPSRDRRGRWTEPGLAEALRLVILGDRLRRRRPLPPGIWDAHVAPFLRFDEPLPNMLYVMGGRSQRHGALDAVEMLDTWHGCWLSCPPMPSKRAGSAAASLPDGRLLVVGGYNERGIVEGLLRSCELYDPFRREWAKAGAAKLQRSRWGHGCAALRGHVYAVGGCSLRVGAEPREGSMETLRCCEVYDPMLDAWSFSAPLQVARSGSRVVGIRDRYLAAVGGCDDVFGRAETQPTIELFDADIGAWSILETPLRQPRTTAGVSVMDDGRLLIVGGAPSLSSAEVFRLQLGKEADIQESQEEPNLEDMSEGRMGCQAAMVNLPAKDSDYPLSCQRCVVVVGGERCNDGVGDWPRVTQFKSIPVYDIKAGSWREDGVVPQLPSPRTAVALCVGLGHVKTLDSKLPA